MESIKREKRVLKLVHPGRHIEVHREPIRAAEVMRKNPRHCITRPDVFKFPWIVVKPESVLLPGSVFLIVPNHTLYHLMLKAKTTQSQSPFSQQNQLPQTNHVIQQFKQDSSKSSTPQRHNNQDHIKLFVPLLSNCVSDTMSQDVENANVCTYEEDSQKKMELLDSHSSFEFRPYCKALKYYEKYFSRDIVGNEMLELKNNDVNLDFVSSEQTTMLKSCLRRQDSMRTRLNLKVSFNLPMKKEGQWRIFTKS